MDHKLKAILSLLLLFPMMAAAHLITITAIQPFPASVVATTSTSASFQVTNITRRVNITVIDQSTFPKDSGLTIAATTCGSLLMPGQSCMIQLALEAPKKAMNITTALKEWAYGTADGVEYPINIAVTAAPTLPEITLAPVNSPLPAFKDPVIAQDASNWLIVSGSTGNFHNFNRVFNTDIYVYNPNTQHLFSVPIANTDLDPEVVKQLSSANAEAIQDGDTLYIIGGYYTANNVLWTNLQTFTSINVPGMISAVMAGQTTLNQYVHVRTDISQFKVIGGQLGKINNYFYLAYGQRCADGGSYCDGQQYTNSIYQFVTDPTLASTAIINTVSHTDLDGSGWRRRDYTLSPFISGGVETLFAMAGPFTPGGNALVWTNGISFNENMQSNDNFINQQANQYVSSRLPMYSARKNVSYLATFSGLSNLYWSVNGLTYDNTTPYGNILDLITTDGAGVVQEYANLTPMCSGQPLVTCLYQGLTAKFIPIAHYYDSRGILQLDQLPLNSKTLVGYIYGGLLSPEQNIFALPPPPNPPNPPSPSYATNQIYAVYVTPSTAGELSWKNITNRYPGN